MFRERIPDSDANELAPPARPAAGARPPRAPSHPLAAPLLPPAIGLIAGIIVDNALLPPTAAAVALAAMGLLIAWLAGRGVRLRNPRAASWITLTGITLSAAGVGMMRHASAVRRVPADHVAVVIPDDMRRLIRVEADVLTPPVFDDSDATAAGAPFPREPRTRFLAAVRAIDTTRGMRPAGGLIQVSVGSAALHVAAGQRVELFGAAFRYRRPDNPGQRDWAAYRRRRGIHVGMWCDNERNVTVVRDTASGAAASDPPLHALRQHLRRLLINDDAAVDDDAHTLLDAMVLGQRGRVERALDDAFVRAGVVHFLAASGMHVAWLAAIASGFMLIIGASYRTSAILCAATIVAYAVVAEPNPPILRAAITAGLFFAARWLRRSRQSGNWLAAAAIILLMLRPGDTFDPGFQFSFAIVAGLLLLVRPLMERFTQQSVVMVGDVPIPLADAHDHGLRRAARDRLLLAVIVALVAWLIGLPIAASHFGRMSPWGWVNSLIMAPVVFVVMLLGVAKLLITALLPTLGAYLEVPLDVATSALARLGTTLSQLPGCTLPSPRPAWWWLPLYYVALYVAIRGPRRGMRFGAIASLAILAALWLRPAIVAPRDPGALRVWVLAVGDGSATILEMPDGRVLAYDLGTRATIDAAEHVILPFLDHRGIRAIDTVVLSHADFDHYGALEGVLNRVPVRRVLINDLFDRPQSRSRAPAALLNRLRERGLDMAVHHAPDAGLDARDAGGDAPSFEMLWPLADESDARLTDNDTSTVLRLTWHGRSILLTGDIEDAAQAALLRRANPTADVLLMPHHGSPRPRTTHEFIRTVDPSVLIRSSGQRDRDTDAALWAAVGERAYYNTADCGAICVEIGTDGIRISTQHPSNGRPFTPAYQRDVTSPSGP